MGLGQRFAQAMASSMSLTSQSQKPATSSRVCAKGPSITVRFGPSNAIRRSEEHTSELQSLMRTSYAVFCLKKKQRNIETDQDNNHYKRPHTMTQVRHITY